MNYIQSRRLEFEILEVLVTMRSREAVVKWRKEPNWNEMKEYLMNIYLMNPLQAETICFVHCYILSVRQRVSSPLLCLLFYLELQQIA